MRNPVRDHSGTVRVARWVRGGLALSLVLLLGMGAAVGRDDCDAEIVVVLSSTNAAFVQAGDAVLDEVGTRAAVVTLEEFTQSCEIDPQRTYIGVGPSAGVHLAETAPAGATIGLCLVPDLRSITVGEGVSAVGINTTVAVKDQIDLLRRAVPSVQRVGVLHRSSSAVSQDWIERLENDPDGPRVVLVDLDASKSVSGAIDDLMDRDVDAIWTFPDPAVYDSASVRQILISSLREQVPVFGFSSGFVRAGALIGVEIDPASQGRQLVLLLERDLEPGFVVESCRLEFALNLVVADRLGVRVPKAVREQAAVVFD